MTAPAIARTARSEIDLQAELAKVEKQIAAGEGDVAAALEATERLNREIQAVKIRQRKEKNDAWRAQQAAKQAEYRARLMPVAEEVADLIPRLLWNLSKLEELEMESYRESQIAWPETNIPQNFARDVRDAIIRASANCEWHFDFVGNPSAKNPLPLQKFRAAVLPNYAKTDIHGNPIDAKGNQIPMTVRFGDFR